MENKKIKTIIGRLQGYKCFWCNRRFSDLIKHTNKKHHGLNARSYDRSGEGGVPGSSNKIKGFNLIVLPENTTSFQIHSFVDALKVARTKGGDLVCGGSDLSKIRVFEVEKDAVLEIRQVKVLPGPESKSIAERIREAIRGVK